MSAKKKAIQSPQRRTGSRPSSGHSPESETLSSLGPCGRSESAKPMKFPLLAIEPKGFAELFLSESDTKRMMLGLVGIYRKRQAALEFFDSDGQAWALEAIDPLKPIPFWLRYIPTLREVDVHMRFRLLGTATHERMKQMLRKAVEADDDVIKQDEEREVILAKLEKTKSIGEIFRLYRWMTKDFRKGEPE